MKKKVKKHKKISNVSWINKQINKNYQKFDENFKYMGKMYEKWKTCWKMFENLPKTRKKSWK